MDFGCVGNIILSCFSRFLEQSAEDGAMGLMKEGMMDPDAESGHLYDPKGMSGGIDVSSPPKPYETDTGSKKMLWETSEMAIGEKFDVNEYSLKNGFFSYTDR